MASTTPGKARALVQSLRPISSRSTCTCLQSQVARERIRQRQQQQHRYVSTGPAQRQEMEVDAPSPRWAQTPSAMKGSLTVRKMNSKGGRHDVNKDPRKLDQMYERFLGPESSKMLSEETRWLAVTHKSFDHGRRGFNDRLAFLGKRIVELQTSLSIVSSSPAGSIASALRNDGEPVVTHPALSGLESLSQESRAKFTNFAPIARIARQYGIPDVVRWVPRNPDNLALSGAEVVYAQVMYAIIGALALEQGGAVANRICRDRLLNPLGLARRTSEQLSEPSV